MIDNLISFVIPCYRSEKTITMVIDEIIKTVAERPEYDYEIICVNDCSPDNVWTVLCDIAEKKLNTVLMIISIAMICAFFLISATYSGGFAMIEKHLNMYVLAIVTFLVILAEGVIIQQKVVDITKIMYPEKTASVYDLKFQKKWVDSCDEAEKIMIGRCAFEAFKVTNSVCGALSIILAISALMFDIGFLPSFVVCLIWLVNQCVYCRAAAKCSKVL